MQGMCDDGPGVCLCDDINCPCAPDGVESYTCIDGLSCGTLKLVDNSCWECCRNQSEAGEVGACCVSDGYGEFDCLLLRKSSCDERNGFWNQGNCTISCNYGACCLVDDCTSGKNPDECLGLGGNWYPGDCNSVDCTSQPRNDFRSIILDEPIPISPLGMGKLPPSGTVKERITRIVGRANTSNSDRDPVDIPNPTTECSGTFNLSETISPSIVIPPTNNKDLWIIEVGSGDCSCCCPGICWHGALGDGGIVNDCSDINKLCYPISGSISSQCTSRGSYDSNSLPTNKPINPKSDVLIPNKNGCVPYLDKSDPKNPIWMTCACCCKGKSCIEYDEPQLPNVCERDSNCKCVNGCDNCFLR